MKPVISVLMPVYNQEKYVADAIRCVLSQTVADWEFIIVDDGSTDRTVEIIKSFDDNRIQLVCPPHEGFFSALKRAMHQATGKWLARMDSDDLCPPDRFEKQLAFLEEHPDCIFLTTAYGIVTPNNKFLLPDASPKWHYVEPGDITLGRRLFCDPATMYSRELAIATSYDDSFGSESPLWYRLLGRGKGIVLEQPLYYVRWRLGSLSRGQWENATEMHYNVRAKYDNANIHKIKKNGSSKLDIKNEKQSVYYCIAAGDLSEARKTAYGVWRRYPLNGDALKLVLASTGLRRLKPVQGPCRVRFSPGPKPF